jgi:hypothetical protein
MPNIFLVLTLISAALVQAEKPKPHDSLFSFDNTIPIIIVGGEWKTVLLFNNTNDQSVTFPISFFNQNGPWSLPLNGLGTLDDYQVSLPAQGSQRIEIDYSGDTQVGFGMVQVPCSTDPGMTCGGVGGYLMLRNHNAARAQDFEVSYQFGTQTPGEVQQFMFDQSNFAQMVVNLTNTCYQSFCQNTTVKLEALDESGTPFFVTIETLAPGEVKILNFAQLSQSTWNRVGMLKISDPDQQVVVSGHRINETGSFTPLVSYNY